ncbi:MAG: glycosyltransferase family 1 protein [Chloroflexota bacterium]|nr:glycosyltransferase family 1 protein [Chloroflexota bacterium]
MATWPFTGCVVPFVAVAQALRQRGHTVGFYTGATARELIEAEGFDLHPFRAVDEALVWEVVKATDSAAPSMWRSPALAYRTFRDWLAGTLRGQVADLELITASFKPDVVVTETSMWGPILILSERRRMPIALLSSFIGCLMPGPGAPPWGPGLPLPRTPLARLWSRVLARAIEAGGAGLRRTLDAERAFYRLPPLGCTVNAYLARLPLYLIPGLRELDYNRADLPAQVHYVGPCFPDRPAHAAAPAWLAELPADRPVVHVTEGTLHYQEPFLLRTAVQALASEPVSLVLTTGRHRSPEQLGLGQCGSNVHVQQWIAHGDLLPRCSVLVTTGGAGTIMASLRAGVPLIVVPTHWDKPDNAQRVVHAGAGIRLDPRRLTPDSLRAAVRKVLADPAFGAGAQRLARLAVESPGPRGAARLLEGLVATPEQLPPAGRLQREPVQIETPLFLRSRTPRDQT